jgi:hypothetical protein
MGRGQVEKACHLLNRVSFLEATGSEFWAMPGGGCAELHIGEYLQTRAALEVGGPCPELLSTKVVDVVARAYTLRTQ